MALSTVRVKINGASLAYPNSTMLGHIENAVKSALRGNVNDTYDITVNVQATVKTPPVVFYPGDVYQYRYNKYGQWYNFVKTSGRDWSGDDMTDDQMRAALVIGEARKMKLIPV